jgi:hypothetical protein
MADTSDRFHWTEGVHVHRVGCSREVSVGYHVDHYERDDEAARARSRAARERIDAWLKEKGYPLMEGTGWVVCERAD